MSNLDTTWANTQADGEFAEENRPPAGYIGVPRVAGTRAGTSKNSGEQYFAVDLVDDQQGYNWAIFKQFTKNGQPHEGRIKSAKITLRQFGLDVPSPAVLPALLKSLEGRYFAVEAVASDQINTVTGQPYVNTNVTGAASPPAVAAPVQTAPPAYAQTPAQVQTQPPPQTLADVAATAQPSNDIPF